MLVKFMLRNNIKNNNGFTLVEMLVAVGIFASVMVVAMGSLLNIIDVNRKSKSIKSAIDNVSFAIDSISRDMQSGGTYQCYSGSSWVSTSSTCISGSSYVKYIGPSGSTQYRFVSNPVPGEGNIQRCIGGACNPTATDMQSGIWQSITAPTSTMTITNLKFYVLGSDSDYSTNPPDRRQPRVLLVLEGQVTDPKKNTQTRFNLQTTISKPDRLNIWSN